MSTSDEIKNNSSKYAINKYDHDFYHEDSNVKHAVFRVKREITAKEEKWKVFEDKVILFTLKASDLSLEEKSFFYSVEGVSFLMNCCKSGLFSAEEVLAKLRERNDK